MEKFALLDFLKAFESLTANGKDKKEPVTLQPQPTEPPAPQPESYEINAMADVLARHEEIANRIRNKK